jgi:hypothetical protein
VITSTCTDGLLPDGGIDMGVATPDSMEQHVLTGNDLPVRFGQLVAHYWR